MQFYWCLMKMDCISYNHKTAIATLAGTFLKTRKWGDRTDYPPIAVNAFFTVPCVRSRSLASS